MSKEEPLKVLVIMGSPRRGNTFHACEELCEKMQKYCAVDFEYIWLKDADLRPCRGCLVCFGLGEDKCPIHDDASVIHRKMNDADGVIFASPVYGMSVTGLMKIFIDRSSFFFHRPRFFDKKAFIIATTGALGHKDVLKYMDGVAGIWGFDVAGKAGLITPGNTPQRLKEKNSAILEKGAKKFSAALLSGRPKKPGLMDVILFHASRAVFSEIMEESPYDNKYWEEKGWLSPKVHYFTDVPVNPFYILIGIIVGKVMGMQMRKNLLDR